MATYMTKQAHSAAPWNFNNAFKKENHGDSIQEEVEYEKKTFAGPPYALGPIDDIPRIIVQRKLIKPGGIFVLEHTPRNRYENFEGFSFQRNYGTTVFSFFTNEADA